MSTKPIWSPSEDLVAQSNLTSFQKYINSKYSTNFKTYDTLHKWSVNSLNDFWSSLIEYEKIIYKGSLFPHIDGYTCMPGTKWYPNMKLNFAQNLLKLNDDSIAIEFSRLAFIQFSALLDASQSAKTICSNQDRLNWVNTQNAS